MRKIIISLILAIVMTLGATQGTISAFAETERKQKQKQNEETPIAQIANDNYKTFNERTNSTLTSIKENEEDIIQDFQDCVESMGGEVHTYGSEEEYNKSFSKEAAAAISTVETYADTVEEVRKTFKVLDRNTSKPIQNAVVRLNGVPRYTDRNGEIKVTLTNPVYELYVEKRVEGEDEQYNPHMEFIYLEDEDANTVKTIYLKRPSDDLEVYAVNLRIGSAFSKNPEYYNLLEQEYHFALDYMDYPADIILDTNKTAEFSCLYVNGKIDRMAVGNDFIFFDYNRTRTDGSPWYKPEDEFSVSFIYDGIESKKYPLLLEFVDLNNIETPEVEYENSNTTSTYAKMARGSIDPITGGPNISQDYGLGDNYSVDLMGLIEFLNKNLKNATETINRPKTSGRVNVTPKFSATYNTRKNSLKIVVGFQLNVNIYKTPQDKSLHEQYKEACKEVDAKQPLIDEKNKEIAAAEEKLKNWKEQERNEKDNYDAIKKEIDEIVNLREQREWQEKEYGLASSYDRLYEYQEHIESEFDSSAKKLSDLTEQIKNGKDAVSVLKNDLGKLQHDLNSATNSILKGSIKFGFELQFLGTFEFNVSNYEIYNVNFSLSLGFSFSYTKHFMAGYIPMYLRASVKVGIKFELVLIKDNEALTNLGEMFRFVVNIIIRGDAGVGLYDIASAGAFLNLAFEFSFQFGDYSDKSYGRFELSIGIRVKILFFEWQFQYPNDTEKKWEWYFYGAPNKKEETAKSAKMMSRSIKLMPSERTTFKSVYQDSRPQLIDIGNGKYLLTWLQDSPNRDDYNRTELVYAVYENGEWSEIKSVAPNNKMADFYPQLYQQGDKVFLAWQRLNSELTEDDTLYDMTSKGEIWVSEFDANSQSFINAQRITNNREMDLTPKFAVTDKPSDDLTVIWQKNSENDMLGMIGTNSIVYSTYSEGNWSAEKTLYTTENIISYVTAAKKDGKLLVSFVEDTDKDIMTSEDRVVKTINSANEIVYSDNCDVGTTQFVKENGKIVLFYYKGGNIVKTDFSTKEVVLNCNTGEFDNGFKVVSNQNGTVIFYDTTGGESKQSYCVVFDSVTDKWTKGIKLSQCADNADYCTGFITEAGSIAFAHIVYDDIQSYAGIIFAEKELKYSVEISDAYFIGSLIDGEEFELSITVKNTGDYEFSQLKFTLFEQEKLVELKRPLEVSEGRTIILTYVANIKNKVSDVIICNALINNVAFDENKYEFFFGHVDYSVDATMVVRNGKQYANVHITNLSKYTSDGNLIVYVNGIVKQSIELKNVCVNGNEYIEITFEDLHKGDYISIEFISESAEIYLANNNAVVLGILDSFKENDLNINPYEQILKFAVTI